MYLFFFFVFGDVLSIDALWIALDNDESSTLIPLSPTKVSSADTSLLQHCQLGLAVCEHGQ